MKKIIKECRLNYYGNLINFTPMPKLPYAGFLSKERYLIEGSHAIISFHSAQPLREHKRDFEVDFNA